MIGGEKVCRGCGKRLSISEFGVAARDGYPNSRCKVCVVRYYADRSRLEARTKRPARQAVARALRDGRLVKQSCEVCGEAKTEAHHDDYDRWLDVRWLCPKHHRELHSARLSKAA